MFGAVSQWINDDEYITCQPRFYVYKWCYYESYDSPGYTCVDADREGQGDWFRVQYVTGRCYIKGNRGTKVLKKCDFDDVTTYAKECEQEGMGFNIAKLDRNRLILTNPIQYHQQGAIGLVTQGTTNPYISSSSKSMDSYFNRNRKAVNNLPTELFPVRGYKFSTFIV